VKILFLDIDGVLNWSGTKERVHNRQFIGIDPEMVARFNRIVDAHPDLKIVISSTWRHSFSYSDEIRDFEGLKKYLADRGVKGEVLGATPQHFGRGDLVSEIEEWLRDNPTLVDSFVVLDDDTRGMSGTLFRDRVVQTYWLSTPDRSGGLQEEDVQAAVKVLGTPLDQRIAGW